MRILFMGGKNVGHGCLQAILERGTDKVVGHFANPGDEDPGRWFASASGLARAHGVPVHVPAKLNSPETLALVRSLEPDFIFVVYYDKILGKELLKIPKRGSYNLHLALAERYRGCYPTTWAIINGEAETGVTLHAIDEGIDSGDIVAQETVPILPGDTGRSLYDKCTKAGIAVFREHYPRIVEGRAQGRPQVVTAETRYYKRDFPSREIDFNASGREIYDRIRAQLFEPFPLPYLIIGGEKYEIRRAGKDPHA